MPQSQFPCVTVKHCHEATFAAWNLSFSSFLQLQILIFCEGYTQENMVPLIMQRVLENCLFNLAVPGICFHFNTPYQHIFDVGFPEYAKRCTYPSATCCCDLRLPSNVQHLL